MVTMLYLKNHPESILLAVNTEEVLKYRCKTPGLNLGESKARAMP